MATPIRSNTDVVRTFLQHLIDSDAEAAIALTTDDVAWSNTGAPTLRGERMRKALRGMVDRGVDFDVDYTHIAESADGIVLTDRIDWLGWKVFKTQLRVSGSFEVRDGLVAVWDDHYSPGALLVNGVRATLLGKRG